VSTRTSWSFPRNFAAIFRWLAPAPPETDRGSSIRRKPASAAAWLTPFATSFFLDAAGTAIREAPAREAERVADAVESSSNIDSAGVMPAMSVLPARPYATAPINRPSEA
jgi:hypothetical protein